MMIIGIVGSVDSFVANDDIHEKTLERNIKHNHFSLSKNCATVEKNGKSDPVAKETKSTRKPLAAFPFVEQSTISK